MDDALSVSAVAALDEPTRRRLYDYVVRQPAPVGRDEVAAAARLPRTTVAFHLDRLVEERLLEVSFERRTGRSGPGAGRPAKLYRRSARQVTVSLPERRYELAGHLLAAALEEAQESGQPPGPILERRARDAGLDLGRDAAGRTVAQVLEELGFEPRVRGDELLLGNCPFHRLAQRHTQLVCGMNLRLIGGIVDGVRESGLCAHLHPAADACCVRLRPDAG